MAANKASHSLLHNVQSLRGIAAFLVMLSHLYLIDVKYSGDPILPKALDVGMAGVDIFFVISGFIMVYVTRNISQWRATNAAEFLFARVTRIYPLYWIMTLATLAVYIIRPDMVFGGSDNTPDILKSFLLWPDDSAPLLQLGWTLIHEMSFYIIFAVLLCLGVKRLPLSLTVWTALIFVGHMAGWRDISPVTNILFHPLSLEFIIGACLGLIYPHMKTTKLLPLILLLAALLGLALAAFKHSVFPTDFERIAIFGTLATMIVSSSVWLERTGSISPKPLQRLGDWSYSLYLTHILTLSLLGRIWSEFAVPGALDNILALTAIVIAAIIIAAITYYLIERPILRVLKNTRKRLFPKQP